jgi:hypothetical protein
VNTPFAGINLPTPECTDDSHTFDSHSHPAVAEVPVIADGAKEPYAWQRKCAECLAVWKDANPALPYLLFTPVLR